MLSASRDRCRDGWQPMLDQAVGDIPMGRPATVERGRRRRSAFLGARRTPSFVTGQVISVNGGSTMP